MKKNKKLIEKIQGELDLIKSTAVGKGKTKAKAKIQPVTHDIKNSYIQNLHMRSSMFMLWVVSTVLSYAHKIPYIKYIISVLSVMYGRTTIWKILVKVRKVFIIFNAAIGVFMVYKTVGFGYENILAGFAGMGHSYLEIFTNFTKRLFNWFVELFDHKVIPNVPGDNPSGGVSKKVWSNGPINKDAFNPQYPSSRLENSLRESYKSLLNIQVEPQPTPWYKDLSTWLWILGGITVVYFGYKFIIDPLFIQELGSGTATARQSPIDGPGPSSEITLADDRSVRRGFEFIGSFLGKIKSSLNPFNWLVLATNETGVNSEGFKNFMARQNHMETAERHLYPFTTLNPYLPWYEQLKINLIGESVFENLKRFKAMEYADRVAKSLEVSKGQFLEVSGATPNVWYETAVATNFHTPIPRISFVDAIHTYNLQNKLNSIPSTPTLIPVTLPVSENILQDVGEWKTFEKAPFTENTDNWLKTWKASKVAGISTHTNKFAVLEVD